jgi:hypothetical protein
MVFHIKERIYNGDKNLPGCYGGCDESCACQMCRFKTGCFEEHVPKHRFCAECKAELKESMLGGLVCPNEHEVRV